MALHLNQLVEIPKLQKLMEKFTLATGAGASILDLEGNVLVTSAWQNICDKFYHGNSESFKNCIDSDNALASGIKKNRGFCAHHCLNGLVDAGVPIIINEEHVANLCIGQFLSEEPEPEFFRQQALKYGFDEEEFIETLKTVPVYTEEQVKMKIDFLRELATFLGELGASKKGMVDMKETQLATLNMMQDLEDARSEAEKLNKKLEKTISLLQASNADLERFAYVASHDLQEPLRKINSFSELFAQKYKSLVDEKGQKYIHYMTDGSKRMQQLISDLLAFSRINSRGKPPVEVDMNELIGQICEDYLPQVKEMGGELICNSLPVIKADPNQISQLMNNLLSNAIKYRKKDVAPKIIISYTEKPHEWLFSVSDNGIGIEKQYFDKIFIIFQRLHGREEYKGTGIGLAVCKQIVNRHGGQISVNSEKGNGSDFRFTIAKKIEPNNV